MLVSQTTSDAELYAHIEPHVGSDDVVVQPLITVTRALLNSQSCASHAAFSEQESVKPRRYTVVRNIVAHSVAIPRDQE